MQRQMVIIQFFSSVNPNVTKVKGFQSQGAEMKKMKKKKKYEDAERREYQRIAYSNIKGPRLKIGKHKFEVLDISQRGLRFLNDKEVIFSEYIAGELTFLCGESVAIEGLVIWEQDDDFGLYLKNLMPSDAIQKEELYIRERF